MNIGQKIASVIGTPTNRTYNGLLQTQDAATTSGFIAGDAITVSGLAQGRNVGTYTSALAVTGADAANYIIDITNAAMNIGQKIASVIGTPTNRTYNGLLQTQDAPTTSGFIAGDAITVSGLAQGMNVGTYTSALAVTGADAANYSITFTDADLNINNVPEAVMAVTNTRINSNFDIDSLFFSTATPVPMLQILSPGDAPMPGAISMRLLAPPMGGQPGLISVSIPSDQTYPGASFSFMLPESMVGADGSFEMNLPSWLNYEPESRIFTATSIPPGALPITLRLKIGQEVWIIAIDSSQEL
jgi:hypothetical protein